ncbi:MAG: repressor LexA [Deltaproteobacteria bacterium]|nr:repressor LexA [Deltaproteobacteria bacterium]
MYSPLNISPKQREVLNFIKDKIREEGASPTYREIAEHFEYKSPKAAVDHVRALEKKGFLRCHRGRSRGIELLISEKKTAVNAIPILGEINAGHPQKQVANRNADINVDLAIFGIKAEHRLFALTVNGDSMKERAIFSGDWVIADADIQPKEGDIVVALIDGENTLKTLAIKEGNYYLKSENPLFKDYTPFDEMIVQGVAKAVLRRL